VSDDKPSPVSDDKPSPVSDDKLSPVYGKLCLVSDDKPMPTAMQSPPEQSTARTNSHDRINSPAQARFLAHKPAAFGRKLSLIPEDLQEED